MHEMNLTLVAFYGSKPDPLSHLVDILQSALHSELGPAFSAYAMEQVHATVIGLEGWRVGLETFNANAVQAFDESTAMNLGGLFRSMQELPPFRVRIGGFAADSLYPFTSRGLHPYLRTFTLNGAFAVMMGWPVAGTSYPKTLDSLRRDCRRYNVLHKYHQKEGDVDNDLFLVLGRVNRAILSEEKSETIQDKLRQLLAKQGPLDLIIQPGDLSVVAYTDTQLPIGGSIRYSLADALSSVEQLKLYYREGRASKVI
jgi:hypothetical protein